MTTNKVVTHDEWVTARKKHLVKEKEFTRLRDQLSRERRELPWELLEKEYMFEGENGRQTLSEVFEGLGLLVLDGQLQRHHGPPEPSRHHDGGRISRTVPEVGRIQEAGGLDVPLVLVCG